MIIHSTIDPMDLSRPRNPYNRADRGDENNLIGRIKQGSICRVCLSDFAKKNECII